MKKTIGISIFALAFAVVAAPALASYNGGGCNDCDNDRPSKTCCPSVDVSSINKSKVSGVTNSTAITGQNIASRNAGIGKITTGNAGVASALTQQIGYNETKLVAPKTGSVKVKNENMSTVDGAINAYAGTGDNKANANAQVKTTAPSRCMPAVTVIDDGKGKVKTGEATVVTEMMQLVGSNLTVTK